MRQLTVCACELVALLLLCSDARAQSCGPVYGGYAASYGYAPSYYAPSYSFAPSYYAPSYGYSGYGGYGYRGSYSGYGYRYNPGGLGGPYSGLGVRPGLGFGGFGLRR
jgi:hypothetical protein